MQIDPIRSEPGTGSGALTPAAEQQPQVRPVREIVAGEVVVRSAPSGDHQAKIAAVDAARSDASKALDAATEKYQSDAEQRASTSKPAMERSARRTIGW